MYQANDRIRVHALFVQKFVFGLLALFKVDLRWSLATFQSYTFYAICCCLCFFHFFVPWLEFQCSLFLFRFLCLQISCCRCRLYRFGLRAAFHWTRVFFLPLYERVCVFADLLFVRLLIAATNLMNCPWGDRCTENGEVSQC